jgi:hypothetical protein
MVWACVCVLIQSVSSLLVPGEARHSQHSEDTFQVLTPTHWLSGLHLCFVTGTFLCNGEVGVEPRYDASVSVAASPYCILICLGVSLLNPPFPSLRKNIFLSLDRSLTSAPSVVPPSPMFFLFRFPLSPTTSGGFDSV